MINRTRHLANLKNLLANNPIAAILGPRQIGKTTIARQVQSLHGSDTSWFDLESDQDRARLADPETALKRLSGLIVIDEVQEMPELFPILRVLSDDISGKRKFLILGSASPWLLKMTSESLAGRVGFLDLGGFTLDELGPSASETLWCRGGFPRAFLSSDDRESIEWRLSLIRTYIERDLPQYGLNLPPAAVRRFWTMLAHYHGQVINVSELGRSFGVSNHTVQRYLDILQSVFMIKLLQPWHENIGKRQVKSPKLYFFDTGILHALLNLTSYDDIMSHPKAGFSWESFAMTQVMDAMNARPEECFFWTTHTGAELDLLLVRGKLRLGFEFKMAGAPSTTKSMKIAQGDLKLDRLYVIHRGEHVFPIGKGIDGVPLEKVMTFGFLSE